ncbi:MAG: hypothetical protein QM622_00475 [Microbacterium sp.]
MSAIKSSCGDVTTKISFGETLGLPSLSEVASQHSTALVNSSIASGASMDAV